MSEERLPCYGAAKRVMLRQRVISALVLARVCLTLILAPQLALTQTDDYLRWGAKQAEAAGRGMREKGQVGAGQGLIHTERATSYKLRATWLTPDVIRATARLLQLSNRLSDEQTRALVSEAEAVGHTAVLVEIDPREGSGVIPLGWQAFLQPKGLRAGIPGAVVGTNTPKLRDVKALAGVAKRDYDYDVFWVVFPLLNDRGELIFLPSMREAELVVRIYDKEGKVSWPIPESIRARMAQLMMKSPQ